MNARGVGWLAVGLVLLGGCAGLRPPQSCHANPVFVPAQPCDSLWDKLVDVVDDYFKIEREQRVRQFGNTLTQGRIDTFPLVSATLLEPWRGDSVGTFNRLESTFQSIRRRAVVQVTPVEDGYLLDFAVYRELEDVARPEFSTVGSATFRNDDSLIRAPEIVGDAPSSFGWIPQGRDAALEQKMIGQLLELVGPGAAVVGPTLFAPEEVEILEGRDRRPATGRAIR